MIDTHAHLQFKAFEGTVDEVIKRASETGVEKIIVVGTNLETSKKAIELAEKYENLYTSVGIHPHHVFHYFQQSEIASSPETTASRNDVVILEELISHPKVVAIGETGLDRHIYENTKYKNYKITDDFIKLQKLFFIEQIKLAVKHQKSLIIHNRQAVSELLQILEENWDSFLESRSVFHCCEPNQKLLDFAIKHKVFIGIDGDITYDKEKQEFLKKTPLELLVLETDSPYFVPEPLKSDGVILNDPKNLMLITESVTKFLGIDLVTVKEKTTKNAIKLFRFKP